VAHQHDPLGGTEVAPETATELKRQIDGGGRPLPEAVRRTMEPEFDSDLSHVRVHDGAGAHRLARSVGATAFTAGSDIFFQQGTFAPDRADGQHLLAHELTHVVEGHSARGAGSTVIGRADDPTERQAEATADRVSASIRAGGSGALRRTTSPATGRPTTTIARLADHGCGCGAHTLRRKEGDYDVKGRKSNAKSDRRLAAKFADAELDDMVANWVKLSTVKSGLIATKRSKELLAIDRAVAAWANGTKQLGGDLNGNVRDVAAILTAIDQWSQTKAADGSARAVHVGTLARLISERAAQLADRVRKLAEDTDVAEALFAKFKKLDDTTAKFAKKNTVDTKVGNFLPDKQKPKTMAHTQKNDDGTLTDEGSIEEANELMEKARGLGAVIAAGVTPDMLREAAAKNKNPLTDRTTFPELANSSDANGEAGGEVDDTTTVPGVTITYDKSDVHAAERVAAVAGAVKAVKAVGFTVPALRFYLPKYGRKITVDKDCNVTAGDKIADAVFHPPGFIAVSSLSTGNAKTDSLRNQDGTTTLKFLSASLGADSSLVHTMIHEMGHAMHYHNARGQFYNLNFATFSGVADQGGKDGADRGWGEFAAAEVSDYGAGNPREFVAELFVGAVTGKKKFPARAWKAYRGLGGAGADVLSKR
jgi:hypothetical protein